MCSGIGEMRLTGGFFESVGCLWILGTWCWQLLVVGNSWLFILPHLYLFHFSLSLSCPCLCNDDIKFKHAHNRHTGGWGVGAYK